MSEPDSTNNLENVLTLSCLRHSVVEVANGIPMSIPWQNATDLLEATMTGHAGVYHQRIQPAARVSVSGLLVEGIMMAEDERARFMCNRSTLNSAGSARRGLLWGIESTKLVS